MPTDRSLPGGEVFTYRTSDRRLHITQLTADEFLLERLDNPDLDSEILHLRDFAYGEGLNRTPQEMQDHIRHILEVYTQTYIDTLWDEKGRLISSYTGWLPIPGPEGEYVGGVQTGTFYTYVPWYDDGMNEAGHFGQRVEALELVKEPDDDHDPEVLPMVKVRWPDGETYPEVFPDELFPLSGVRIVCAWQPFLVYETSSDYRIMHLPTRQVRAMGDGVDMFDGAWPGTPEFDAAMTEMCQRERADLLEAYFPEVRGG